MITYSKGTLWLKDPLYYQRGFGRKVGLGKISLTVEEALYLAERGVKLEGITLTQLLAMLKNPFLYIAYREMREKGKRVSFSPAEGKAKPSKLYEGKGERVFPYKLKGFAKGDVVLSPSPEALFYYKQYWFGQWGRYKVAKGRFAVYSPYEAVYLREKGALEWEGSLKLPKHFEGYYAIYKDWVDKGFVLKSGFKFGADFRLYDVGVSPERFQHSLHLINVFPKRYTVSAQQLSRSIRVAHGVRKTYILAIPQRLEGGKARGLLYFDHYAVKVYGEREKVRAKELYAFLGFCRERGLSPLLAFVDDEGSTTFYEAKEVLLKGSSNTYFEVEWKRI